MTYLNMFSRYMRLSLILPTDPRKARRERAVPRPLRWPLTFTIVLAILSTTLLLTSLNLNLKHPPCRPLLVSRIIFLLSLLSGIYTGLSHHPPGFIVLALPSVCSSFIQKAVSRRATLHFLVFTLAEGLLVVWETRSSTAPNRAWRAYRTPSAPLPTYRLHRLTAPSSHIFSLHLVALHS